MPPTQEGCSLLGQLHLETLSQILRGVTRWYPGCLLIQASYQWRLSHPHPCHMTPNHIPLNHSQSWQIPEGPGHLETENEFSSQQAPRVSPVPAAFHRSATLDGLLAESPCKIEPNSEYLLPVTQETFLQQEEGESLSKVE